MVNMDTTPDTTDDMTDAAEAQNESTSELLVRLGEETRTETLSVGALVDALQDRAFGILLLILALPCCIPFLYGVPQAVSIPLVFVAAQIVMGRHKPWLPDFLKKRSFSTEAFRNMVNRAAPYVRWFEVLSRPRFTFLTGGKAERIWGLFMLIFCASIAVPLPLTNTIPGFAVSVMALGFIEKDGLLIVAGTIIGTIWVTFLVALGSGLVTLIEQAIGALT